MLSIDRAITPDRFEQWNDTVSRPIDSPMSAVPPAPSNDSIKKIVEETRPSLGGFILPRRPITKCNGDQILRPAEPKELANAKPAGDCNHNGLDSAIVQQYLSQIVELLKKLLEQTQKNTGSQPFEPQNPASQEEMLTLIVSIAISLMQQVQPQGAQLTAQFEQSMKGQIIFA